MQTQFGVDTPDFGLPWKSRQFEFHNGLLGLPADLPIQPRLEGELALLIGRKPEGPNIKHNSKAVCDTDTKNGFDTIQAG